jgi:hypothetical protein
MKRAKICVIMIICLLSCFAQAQSINVNPDPNGSPWIAGDALLTPPEILSEIHNMILTTESANTELPYAVDNSQLIFMPPVFNQGASNACVQVAEIWYTFAYEINRLRNDTAGIEIGDEYKENQYHPFFTYNFLNHGENEETSYFSGFYLIKETGCPSYDIYDDPYSLNGNGKYRYWMYGYNNYKSGFYNKIYDYENITWDNNIDSLVKLKHWIADHNSGDTTGGLAIISVFADSMPHFIEQFNNGTPGYPDHYLTRWGHTGGHALTIVGYNDSVQCFNLNGDDEYRENFASPYKAAELGYIDEIIYPHNTRKKLAQALDMTANKSESNPPKKHGNIPL